MALKKLIAWLLWRISPVQRPKSIESSFIAVEKPLTMGDLEVDFSEIRNLKNQIHGPFVLVTKALSLVTVADSVISSPKGYSFFQGAVIAESNSRGGDASDSVALDRASPWPEKLLTRRREVLLDASVPKFFFRLRFANFYHFLLESLPELLLVEGSFHNVHIFLPPNLPNFVTKNLPSAINAGHFEILEKGQWRVKNQILTTIERSQTPHSIALKTLRGAFAAGSESADLRLYVSRSGSSRGLRNETELEDYLALRGFRILRTDDLSDLRRNADLFGSASLVVGPHGAGLSNIVFCRPGTTVIEFSAPHRESRLFAGLCHRLGLRYFLEFTTATDFDDYGDGREVLTHIDGFFRRGNLLI